jgi:hypothetical protein
MIINVDRADTRYFNPDIPVADLSLPVGTPADRPLREPQTVSALDIRPARLVNV